MRATALLSLLATMALVGCHPGPSEPSGQDASAPAMVAARPSQDTHRIIEADHRQVLHLRRDDRLVLPVDPAFDWRIAFEDPSGFADAGSDGYRIKKAGTFRIMVYGDPKCLKTDGGCGLSKRRWDVTVDVR